MPAGSLPGGQTAPFNPTAWATISAVAGASPVTITVRTPSPFNSEMREIESVRGGSLRAINPMIWLDAAGPAATAKTRKPCFSSSSAIAAAAGEGAVRATTAVNAPLMIRSELPAGSVAVASEVFLTGSNGTKTASFGKPVAVFCDAASRMAASTGSWPPSELASAAIPRTWASSNPGNGRTLATVSSLRVRVPVLSEHNTSIDAASSTAESRVGNTPCLARARAPIAAARVNVAGNATGMMARTDVSKSGIISVEGIAW